LRITFFGSGAFAIPSFEALLDAGHDLAALVTQPDKEKGRGRVLAPPPLKPVAEARGVPVRQPRGLRDAGTQEALRALAPDLQVVVAFGRILPGAVIDVSPGGTVNVHASLLPRYRGAAPVQWAIVNGETETGVTTMLIDEGLDTGPLLMSRPTPIGEDETAVELEARLARLGADLLLETVRAIADGTATPRAQDHRLATSAPIIRKEDGRLDWRRSATDLARRIRGFHPWPGMTARHRGRELKVLRARPEAQGAEAAPGTVAATDAGGVVVVCGGGTRLRLLEVQPESRRAMPAAAFAAGARIVAGDRFD
jgi:methionyl-tRNA formyltransferase